MEVRQIPNEILIPEVVMLLNEGKSVVMRVKGSSMLPFIRGDRDSVELLKPQNYEVGDFALACIAPGRYVLHRIDAIDVGRVVLRGTGNLTGTEECAAGDVCGVVVRVLKPSGKAVDCNDASFRRTVRRWVGRSYWFRRIFLGIYRRLI